MYPGMDCCPLASNSPPPACPAMPNDVEQHRFPSHQPDNRQRRLNFNFAVFHQAFGRLPRCARAALYVLRYGDSRHVRWHARRDGQTYAACYRTAWRGEAPQPRAPPPDFDLQDILTVVPELRNIPSGLQWLRVAIERLFVHLQVGIRLPNSTPNIL